MWAGVDGPLHPGCFACPHEADLFVFESCRSDRVGVGSEYASCRLGENICNG